MLVDVEMTISFVISRVNVIHIYINMWILKIIVGCEIGNCLPEWLIVDNSVDELVGYFGQVLHSKMVQIYERPIKKDFSSCLKNNMMVTQFLMLVTYRMMVLETNVKTLNLRD